jgi:hypothetical protein
LLTRSAQAQSASLDLRRAPLPADSQTVDPAEVPVQIPPPCADTTKIYEAADSARGVHPPILVHLDYAALGQHTRWHADFVVGTDGAPEGSSIVMTRNGRPSRDGKFRDAIEALRYQPASLNGCAVRFKGGLEFSAGGG